MNDKANTYYNCCAFEVYPTLIYNINHWRILPLTKDTPHAVHFERSNLWKNLLYFIKDVLLSSYMKKKIVFTFRQGGKYMTHTPPFCPPISMSEMLIVKILYPTEPFENSP